MLSQDADEERIGDKPPVFTLVDRGSGQRYVVLAKSADEVTVRLLLVIVEKESLTVYTGGFRAYDPLDDNECFHRESVITLNRVWITQRIVSSTVGLLARTNTIFK